MNEIKFLSSQIQVDVKHVGDWLMHLWNVDSLAKQGVDRSPFVAF